MKFKNLSQYLAYFSDLIKKEREAEIDFHLTEIQSLSGRQREKKGRAILLLNGSDAGPGIGGTYLVKLSRAQDLPENEISNGDVVVVSKEKPNEKDPYATVVSKGKRSITIAYEKAPPFICYSKNIRLDLFSNDITFQRMEHALGELEKLKISQKILLNKFELNKESIYKDPSQYAPGLLNKSQEEALIKAMNSEHLFLIQGPPGTGKTTTLSAIISALANTGKKILACAPSNTAVDNLLEKLNRNGVKCLRIG
ncbi:MAG: AAA domain-containing protein, partial [Nitrososphaeraceae archaeon]|nr:AAA domain-containing protein [Nitrososphaeraceae archaeon]